MPLDLYFTLLGDVSKANAVLNAGEKLLGKKHWDRLRPKGETPLPPAYDA